MPTPPISPDELDRLRALRALNVLDSPTEPEFDALVQIAALICGVPIALVSLVDEQRQWFKANLGLPGLTEIDRKLGFCSHAVSQTGIFEVPDTRTDPRFADHPLVRGEPHIRFYVGVPLRLATGEQVGTLCALDQQPHQLNDTQRSALSYLASVTVLALEGRHARLNERAMLDSLADKEARLRQLYDQTPALLHSTDTHFRILSVSDQWLTLMGYQRDEVVGQSAFDFVQADSAPALQALLLLQLQQHGVADKVEFQAVKKTGELLDGRLSVSINRNHLGKPTRYLCVTQDMTEVNAANRSRDELLNTIRNEFVLSISDRNGTLIEVNDAMCQISGYSRAELVGATGRILASGYHPKSYYADMWQTILRGHSWRGELCNRNKSGQLYWGDAVIAPMRGSDGQIQRFAMILTDISQRKAQEVDLRKNERLLRRTGEVAGVGGWELDLSSNKLWWSDQTCLIHGLPPATRVSLEQSLSYLSPESRPAVLAAHEAARDHGTGWDLECQIRRTDGQLIWVRMVGDVDRLQGRPIRIFGAIQDIGPAVAQRQAVAQAHQRVTVAMQSAAIGVWEYRVEDGSLSSDAWMQRHLGLPENSVLSLSLWCQRLHPEDRAGFEQALQQSLANLTPLSHDYRVMLADGELRYLRAAGQPLGEPGSRDRRLLGVNFDLTPVKRLALELAEKHELLRVTLQAIGDAVITTDPSGLVTWLNPAAERMTGWINAEACGRPLNQIYCVVQEGSRIPAENVVQLCLLQRQAIKLGQRIVLVSKQGQEFGIEDSASPIHSERGQLLGVVLVFHDLTEQRRLSGEMDYRATHDVLTGLVNRAEFEARLRRVVTRAQNDHSENSLLFVDLDQFRLVNDNCGHSAGDQLLKQIATLLAETVRGSDTLARLGGDEFAAILEHCSLEQAQKVAQKICDRVDGYRFVHDERRFRVGTSIGLAPVDGRWSSAAAVLQAATTACEAAKEAGRNRVQAWFDKDSALLARHQETQWASRLEQALDENRFVLYAQGIEPLAGPGIGLYLEVLIRLLDTDGSIVPPGLFLPAAERYHLAGRIDRWVLRHALHWLSAPANLARVELLSLNLSGQSVGDRAFHRHAIDELGQVGPEICRRLCIEVTETAAITNMADASVFIEQLRALGLKVALDDFGAGASSFGYLKSLPVDIIKIDGHFVKNLVQDPLSDAAVRCFVEVANILKVKTVAEFVDNPDVLTRIQTIGVDYAQGFFLHRPMPLESL